MLAAKVNNFLQMGFWQRIGAGGEGKKIFWRWDCSEGWVLAAKVKKNLEMESRRGMGAGGEGKQFFADGISAKDRCWR